MNLKELERYILNKPDAKKRAIPHWDYIRYTVYDSAFATLSCTKRGIVLTVWGTFPQYKEQFPRHVRPAVQNEPAHFTDILLSDGIVPDYVIRAVIDSSYSDRSGAVIMPYMAKPGYANVPYCGIVSNDIEFKVTLDYEPMENRANIAYKDANMAKTKSGTERPYELIGTGKWDGMPYSIAATEEAARKYKELLDLLAADIKSEQCDA